MRLLRLPFLVGLAALGLAGGCSTSSQVSSAIRIRWSHDPETLDPLVLPNQFALEGANLLHYSLLQTDYAQHVFSPALAAALPAVQLLGDSLTRLTYRLRPEAAWDARHPLSARDVEFTLKLMQCPGVANEGVANSFRFIEAVERTASDSLSFAFRCRGQAPEYVQASGDFFILPEFALDPDGELRPFALADLPASTAPRPSASRDSALVRVARRYRAAMQNPQTGLPGCGPYELVRWEKDRYLSFRRKVHWWAEGLRPVPFVLQARPAQLDFVIIPDDATATLALRRGEIDLYPQVPAAEFARLRQSAAARQELAFYSMASYDVVTAGFNTRRPALTDAGTRQALSRLFDAAGLLQATQRGAGRRTVGLISPADRANYNDSLPLVPFAPTEAAAMLRQAGWQRGATGWQRFGPNKQSQSLHLRLRYRNDDALFETVALQFRAAAAGLAIPVELLPTESATLATALRAGDFDVYVRTLKGNPFVFNFAPILHSSAVGAGNLTGFGTSASDRLITAVAAAPPQQKRRRLRQFQAMLQREAPLVPLFFLPVRIAARRNLTNLNVSGLKPGYAVTALTRTTAPPAP